MTVSAAWHPPVRAVYDAFNVPGASKPYDTVHLRVDYPAGAVDPHADPRLGIVPVDVDRVPLPVILMAGNFNCPPHLYYWLTHRLALAGAAVVTWTWVADLHAGRPGLSTGIDLLAFTAEAAARHPSPMLAAMLDKLANLAELPSESLDLSRLVLGGHSAGGTWALLSAPAVATPSVKGVFSYGGHTRTQTPQGFGVDHYLSVDLNCPALLLFGDQDEVVSAIGTAQGHDVVEHPMLATARYITSSSAVRVERIAGANHYSMAEGYDGTTGRGYLEHAVTTDEFARLRIGTEVESFVRDVLNLGFPQAN